MLSAVFLVAAMVLFREQLLTAITSHAYGGIVLSRGEILRLATIIVALAIALGLSPIVGWAAEHQLMPRAVTSALIYAYIPMHWLVPAVGAALLARYSTARILGAAAFPSVYVLSEASPFNQVPASTLFELIVPGFFLAVIVLFGKPAVRGSWLARAVVVSALGSYFVAARPWFDLYASRVLGGQS